MLKRRFTWWCIAIALFYATTSWLGLAPLSNKKVMKAPESVRQQPGGYRSYTYWRSGK
jgi:hypothetical protein